MTRLRHTLTCLACCLGAMTAATASAAPVQIAAQGRLSAAGGGPVADGGYAMAVAVYDAPKGGKPLFTESFLAVQATGGVFALALGAAAVPLDSAVFSGGKPLFVGVTVGGDPELPLAPLRPVPLAIRANSAAAADVAGDVQCSGCVSDAELAKGAVTSDKIANGAVKDIHANFNWAAANEPGGVANYAVGANLAKQAELAKLADFAEEAGSAKKLACTGCVGAGQLDAAVLAPYAKTASLAKVALSNKFSDLDGGPDLSGYAAFAKDATWAGKHQFKLGLDTGNAQVVGMRLQNADKDPVPCGPEMLGFVYFHTAKKSLAICTGSEFVHLAVEPAYGTDAKPGTSCKDILAKVPSTAGKNAAYWVKTASSPKPYQVFCDMTNAGGGWTLILNNTDSKLRTILNQDAELTSQAQPGGQKYVFDLLNAAGEIRYTDTSGKVFLEANFDGPAYTAAIQQGASKAIAVTYKAGPLAGKQRYAEVNASFHWGHRHNVPTTEGKPTNVQDVYNDSCRHVCWEDVAANDRAFSGDHCPSGTTPSLCPATNPPYVFPAESTRGGSFKFHKWVR